MIEEGGNGRAVAPEPRTCDGGFVDDVPTSDPVMRGRWEYRHPSWVHRDEETYGAPRQGPCDRSPDACLPIHAADPVEGTSRHPRARCRRDAT